MNVVIRSPALAKATVKNIHIYYMIYCLNFFVSVNVFSSEPNESDAGKIDEQKNPPVLLDKIIMKDGREFIGRYDAESKKMVILTPFKAEIGLKTSDIASNEKTLVVIEEKKNNGNNTSNDEARKDLAVFFSLQAEKTKEERIKWYKATIIEKTKQLGLLYSDIERLEKVIATESDEMEKTEFHILIAHDKGRIRQLVAQNNARFKRVSKCKNDLEPIQKKVTVLELAINLLEQKLSVAEKE